MHNFNFIYAMRCKKIPVKVRQNLKKIVFLVVMLLELHCFLCCKESRKLYFVFQILNYIELSNV